MQHNHDPFEHWATEENIPFWDGGRDWLYIALGVAVMIISCGVIYLTI